MNVLSARVAVARLSEDGGCDWGTGSSPAPAVISATETREALVTASDSVIARGGAWRATGIIAFVRDAESGVAYAVRAASTEDASSFARVLDDCCCCCSSSSRSSGKADGGGDGIKAAAAEEVVANGGAAKKIKATAAGEAPPSPTEQDAFERKIDAGSAELYFHYYGMLQHQQNMLQDYVRTGTYWAAILENSADFKGKVVVDVGAGSGILSLFAAQAGAERVYAVEASEMAEHARRLCEANRSSSSSHVGGDGNGGGGRGRRRGGGGERVTVIRSRVESAPLPRHCADVLVSEPMGTLLLNERMLETYVYARDTLLKPGGRMFPALGRIHVAAFSDPGLHAEMASRASFWNQRDFYGVDLRPLREAAGEAYFRQVVVDAVDPACLVSAAETAVVDFGSATAEELARVSVPLRLVMATGAGSTGAGPCVVHGVAAWFDVLFDGSGSDDSGGGGDGSDSGGNNGGGDGTRNAKKQKTTARQRWLSTAPGLPTTHWFQLRCVLREPLVVPGPGGAVLEGELVLEAHERQSYDMHLSLSLPAEGQGQWGEEGQGEGRQWPRREARATFDLKDPYYRQAAPWGSGSGSGGGSGYGWGSEQQQQQQQAM